MIAQHVREDDRRPAKQVRAVVVWHVRKVRSCDEVRKKPRVIPVIDERRRVRKTESSRIHQRRNRDRGLG